MDEWNDFVKLSPTYTAHFHHQKIVLMTSWLTRGTPVVEMLIFFFVYGIFGAIMCFHDFLVRLVGGLSYFPHEAQLIRNQIQKEMLQIVMMIRMRKILIEIICF